MSFSVSYLKLRILIFIAAMLFLWQALRLLPWLQAVQSSERSLEQTAGGAVPPVVVTIFYEALCPDSKSFIVKQVVPAFERAPHLMSINFVPYGKARTNEDANGNLSFSCQHGPVECEGNKVHACAISHISDMGLLVKYISCMISNNMNPEYISRRCGEELSIDPEPILRCSRSRTGAEMLKHYGELTSDNLSSQSFIPTVLLNNQWRKQSAILKDLFKEVCAMYDKPPLECSPPK